MSERLAPVVRLFPPRSPWWYEAWCAVADERIGAARIRLARRLGWHCGEVLYTGLGRWRPVNQPSNQNVR